MVWNLPDDVSLLGVIDLRLGQAVHAIAGDRAHYQPIAVPHADRGDPLALIRYYERLGLKAFYLADLDRLMGGEMQWETLRRLLESGHEFWFDLGLSQPMDLEFARRKLGGELTDHQVTWIIATESLSPGTDWTAWRQHAKSARLAIGIDLRGGQFLGPVESVEEIVRGMDLAAIDRCVVLDLAAVGTGSGPVTMSVCEHLKSLKPDAEIASGGGVRSERDALALYLAGCRRILVATALLKPE